MRLIVPSVRRFTILLAALAVMVPAITPAAVSPAWRQRTLEARLLTPAAGERTASTGVRFVYQVPKGAREQQVLLSTRAFDPTGWTAIDATSGIVAVDASHGAPALEQAMRIDADTPLWWAVAWRDGRDGTLRFSPVQTFTALRAFANRVAGNPILLRETTGRMTTAEISPRRAAMASGAPVLPRPQIHLSAGYDFVPGTEQPAVPAGLAHVQHVTEDGADPVGAYLVQFADPPGEAERAVIAAAGGAITGYVPDQAYLVRMSTSAAANLAMRDDVVEVEFQPAFKLSPLVGSQTTGAAEFDVRLFPDADLARAQSDIAALGASGMSLSNNGINHLLRFTVDRSQLASIASLNSVQWIEPRTRFVTDNLNAQWIVQTGVPNNRNIWSMGLQGQGQVVMTTDSGVNTNHYQFVDPLVPITDFGSYPTHRKIIAYQKGAPDPSIAFGDHSGASYHGTHTAGTLCGNDSTITGGNSTYDGVAKMAKLWFMDLSGPALANGISPPADLNDIYQPGYTGNAGGAARMASNSWGSTVNGAYTLESQQVDQFMWLHPDFLINFSNGNSSTVGTVGSPATSKNCGGVGGVNNGSTVAAENGIYTSTSRGPCADGRRKPTYAAPASPVTSANGGTVNGYQALSGTSMASPGATGAIALMREYLTEGWYPTGAPVVNNGFPPSAALMKAMAINSCVDSITTYFGPSNNIGWGRICADSVLYFAGDSRRLVLVDHTQGLGQGDYVEYQVRVTTGLIPLKVSLVWTDYPGDPSVSRQLVNDLDLTVTDPLSNTYKGNVFTNRKSTLGGSRDSINVEEGVRVPSPGNGLWTIRISAKAVPIGPQPFALVVTGGLASGGGTLAMDRTLYGTSGNVLLQVTDPDASGPVTVNVSSSSEGTPEAVSLSGSNGVFNGSIALSNAQPTPDGVLQVSDGDVITASYTDATYAANLTTQAKVNIDTPIITNVKATSQGAAGTLITWTTDRNSTSKVYWGATTALEKTPVSSSDYALTHSLLLTGLTAGQTYLYDVESVGLTGGSARDNLGGDHRQFTAKANGDFLLLLGEPGFGHLSTWMTTLTSLGLDYDVWSDATADNAVVGDLNSGLRSYKAVLWQAGPNTYPAFSTVQQAAVDSLLKGGGRLMVTGHDIGWGMVDPSSPGYTASNAAWVQNSLRVHYKLDPTIINATYGFAGDPISSPNQGGNNYEPWGSSGQSGDEIGTFYDPLVTSAGDFRDDFTPDTTVIRWETLAPNGSPANAFWGGQVTRLAAYFHEWSGMMAPAANPDTARDGVLDRTLQWLLGRARPTVTVVSPNGGEVVNAGPLNITWNETVAGGLSVAARRIEYSLNGGDSWVTLTTSAGPSPYAWNLSGVPNATAVKVRVRITDNGAPAFSAIDASDATFTLQTSGGDTHGPVVVAGSIQPTPNPIVIGNAATVIARTSDASTGGSTIAAAEFSFGDVPAPAGAGTAMTSTFDSVEVHVSGAINTNALLHGDRTLWVRARDAAGNWGPATALGVHVNGTDPAGVAGEIPRVTYLAPSAPNPSAGSLAFRFGLAKPAQADLAVYDATGRLVRSVTRGALPAGTYSIHWDGRDAAGNSAAPGLYFVRLQAGEALFQQRIVRLN
jgi:hypothetical protein